MTAIKGLPDTFLGEEISIRALAEQVIAIMGSSSRIEMVRYEKAYEAGFEDMQRRVPDVRRIHSLLGWRPQVSLDETLSRVRDWLCQCPEEVD